jgi:methylenetetrahydrofolate dehydrogenase (NADP+) / methenyltetrahydrofolate cyclohydrolase
MTATIFNGRTLAQTLQQDITTEVARLTKTHHTTPTITTVIVGDDPASLLYLRLRENACKTVGIHTHRLPFPASASETEVLSAIRGLNKDPAVHGILVQYPLPPSFHPNLFMSTVDPQKDVEGFHPLNLGRTLSGDERLVPCTPHAVLTILTHEHVPLKGADVVIVNHSIVVGKPLAALLINRDATVTVCHVFTKDLKQHTTKADILVSGAGVPGLITEAHVKQGATVLDVGTKATSDGVLGDVAFETVKDKAGFITPVPGGVGPVTTTMALFNMVKTFKLIHENG